ncbi:MAG: benzoate transporter [Solirubrobacterales bacterium]|nr:benzoate transporter [Solirubrobacterales bacterium]
MARRAWLIVGLVALATLIVSAPAGAKRTQRPRAFSSCAQLVRYARAHFAVTHGYAEPPITPAMQTTQTTGPVPKAPTNSAVGGAGGAGTTFSTTNNQEAGVDEPDLVKTDGATIFAASEGKVFAVAVGAGGPRLAGSLAVPGGNAGAAQLLLRGSRLIVISGGGPVPVVGGGGGALRPTLAPAPYYYGAKTTVTEVDVHDPAAMKVARTMTIDGNFVDARQNGATARLVISSAPRAVPTAGLRNRAQGWIPSRRFRSRLSGRHYVRAVAACPSIRRPAQFSGLGMLTILTINLDRGLWAADSDALMADAQVVYGSPSSLYVATQKWIDPQTPATQVPTSETTVIHRFDVTNPDRTTFVSSGEVPGYLLNQFSLSEYKGALRVATTSRPIWWNGGPATTSQSQVTVLQQRGGVLAPVGQVSGLGRGQQIYSVRFLDDAGYVVTFHQVDPLYTLDLSSPAAPRVAGHLELQGYSSYLHPIGPGLLLGVGQAVGGGNEPSGTQLELFDVSDPATPKLLQRTLLGDGSSSAVSYDHHAFLFWPATGLAVLPSTSQDFTGAIGFHIARSGIAEAGRIVHDPSHGYSPTVLRALVVGDRLFTLSDEGVMASSLDSLARRAFVAFR